MKRGNAKKKEAKKKNLGKGVREKLDEDEFEKQLDELERQHYNSVARNIRSIFEANEGRTCTQKYIMHTLLMCIQRHMLFNQRDFKAIVKSFNFQFTKAINIGTSGMKTILGDELQKSKVNTMDEMMLILSRRGVDVTNIPLPELQKREEWKFVQEALKDDNRLKPAYILQIFLKNLLQDVDCVTNEFYENLNLTLIEKIKVEKAAEQKDKIAYGDSGALGDVDNFSTEKSVDNVADENQDVDSCGSSPSFNSTDALEDVDILATENQAKVVRDLLKLVEGKIQKILPNEVLEGEGFYSKCPGLKPPVECSIEIYPTRFKEVVPYLDNLDALMNKPNVIGYYSATQGNEHVMVCLQRYTKTFADVILVEELWEEKEHLGVYGFSEFFINTLQQLLSLIDYLITNKIEVSELDMESIVYAKEDSSFRTPLLRRLFSGNLQCSWKEHYYGRIKDIILRTMNNSKKYTYEVCGFLKHLGYATLQVKHLQEHPVFWMKTEKLQFLVDIRNDIRFGRLSAKNKMMNAYFTAFNVDWQSIVKQVPELKSYFEKSIQWRKQEIAQKGEIKEEVSNAKSETFENTMKELVSYFRNGYEHINDDIPDDEEEKKVKSAKLEEHMETHFPSLITYLYQYLASVDKSWSSFSKKREI